MRDSGGSLKFIGFDTETCLITTTNKIPQLVVISFFNGAKGKLAKPEEGIQILTKMISDPEVCLVGHNVAFDLAVCIQAGLDPELVRLAYESDRIFDTMVQCKSWDIASGKKRKDYKLDTLAQQILKHPALDKGADSWRLRYSELIDIPLDQWPSRASEYALKDSEVTLKLFQQLPRGPELDRNLQCRAAWALLQIGANGMAVDPERLNRFREILEYEQELLFQVLFEAGIVLKDRKGVKHASKAALLKMIPEEHRTYTDKGNVKTGHDTFDKLTQEFEYPKHADSAPKKLLAKMPWFRSNPAQAYIRYKKIEKILATYVRNITMPSTHPYFNVLVDSGRTSCRGPNLQNIPREPGIRELFVPRPGYVFCSVDYNTLELRTLGHVLYEFFGLSSLRDLYQNDPNADPHLKLGAELLGISFEQAKKDKGTKKVKEARQEAKAPNFGFPGGLGLNSFREFSRLTYNRIISEERAKQLKDAWFKAYPEMRKYFYYINDLVEGGKPFEMPGSGRLRAGCTFTSGANNFFQGLASDAAKEALWQIYWKFPQIKMVNFVHDELIFEVAIGSEHLCDEVADLMCRAGEVWCYHVPLRAEPALSRRWYKGAECVRVGEGKRLVIDETVEAKDEWAHLDVAQFKALVPLSTLRVPIGGNLELPF